MKGVPVSSEAHFTDEHLERFRACTYTREDFDHYKECTECANKVHIARTLEKKNEKQILGFDWDTTYIYPPKRIVFKESAPPPKRPYPAEFIPLLNEMAAKIMEELQGLTPRLPRHLEGLDNTLRLPGSFLALDKLQQGIEMGDILNIADWLGAGLVLTGQSVSFNCEAMSKLIKRQLEEKICPLGSTSDTPKTLDRAEEFTASLLHACRHVNSADGERFILQLALGKRGELKGFEALYTELTQYLSQFPRCPK